MAITAYGMDFQSRVPMPCLAKEIDGEWMCEFQSLLANRHRPSPLMRFILIDEVVVITKEIVVHTFNQGDVDDPDLYAAEPLWNWQNSDQGTWVMKNALETPVWHRMADPQSFGHKYIITATFAEKKLTEYYLRFGDAHKRVQL